MRTLGHQSTSRFPALSAFLVIFQIWIDRSLGHVSLTYPPARSYALDFLDSARTTPPCGMPRGSGPVTDLKSGSNLSITWDLGYAHDGGFRIEILTYATDGKANVTYYLTPQDGKFVGADNKTATSFSTTLPVGFTCQGCTIRLVRQALNWGPYYLFWSCADVNILPASEFTEQCSRSGIYRNETMECMCNATFSGSQCQYKDECDRDVDCGTHGQCKRVTQYSFPQKQCFCQQGWFGTKCQNVSMLNSVSFDPTSYNHNVLSKGNGVEMFHRILQDSGEIEVVVRARTQSYIGLGWKRRGSECKATSDSPKSDSSFPEPISDGTSHVHSTSDTPIAEPIPEGGSSPEPEPTPEPEPESQPEPGWPSSSPVDSNGMDCTDMVIGSVIGKLARIHDYYSRDRSTPKLDEFYGGSQSLTAAVGEVTSDGMTTIMFRKPLSANEQTDQSFVNESMVIIWAHGQAYGDTTGVGDFYRPDELKYHASHKGVLSLNLFDTTMASSPKSKFILPGKQPSGSSGSGWSYPPSCTLTNSTSCQYTAHWFLDDATDEILFTIKAKQPPGTWTGIAFSNGRTMERMDLVFGLLNSSNHGMVIDGWIGSLHSTPVRDQLQNIHRSGISYENGFLQMNFTRLRASSDLYDLSFTNNDCYYFTFPVLGGTHTTSGSDIFIHTNTPIVSSDKICIKSSDSTDSGSRHFINGIYIIQSTMAILVMFYCK